MNEPADSFDAEAPIDDQKVETAVFGREVARFLAEDRIGRYIVAKAAEETENAVLELKDVDPDQPSKIRAIQTRIRIAESVIEWLVGAVKDGEMAEKILEEDG